MARRWVLLVVLGGCGFSLQLGGDDQVPDGRQVQIVDDAADDFTGTVRDATIAVRGAIEPDAFVLRGLHARAFEDGFDNGMTYEQIIANLGEPQGEGYAQVPFRFQDTGVDHPRGLGITTDIFTILYEGEIHLPGGVVDLEVDADDRCALQLMLDGATWTESLLDAYDSANPHRTIAVPADGWYPIRAAFTQSYGSSFFDIHFTPSGGTRTHVDANHTRARVTDTPGLIVEVFPYRALLRSAGRSAVPTVDENFMYAAPAYDLSGLPSDDFSVRYSGQLRIDEPGTYTFYADASTGGNDGGDLWRIWVDGIAIAGPWAATPTGKAEIDLAPGWHDFAVDFADDDLEARITAKLSGPGIPDGPIDPSRLRPAVATGLVTSFSELSVRTQIKDASSAPTETTVGATVEGPPGAKVVAVDWGFGIEYSRMSDLTARRIDCTSTGTPVTLGNDTGYFYFAADTACAGSTFPLEWKYAVTDSVSGGIQGNVWNPIVAVTYRGGDVDAPFAKQAVYTSPVRETPGAIGYGRVHVDANIHDAMLMIEVRTAADAASIEGAAWVTVIPDELLAVPAGEVLQYRITLASDGWELATVERVAITYVVHD